MKISNVYSPNFDKKKRSHKSIKCLVIHYTGMQSERESIKRLCNPKSKVSSHYLINQNGKVYRLVMDNRIAWHAGKSCWGKYKNLNKNSIGIEMVNKGHKFGYTNFKKKQLSSLIKICKNLIKKYKIKRENIVGHSDIAPLRKIDPGKYFPWKKLSENMIGLWSESEPKDIILKKNDLMLLLKNLKKIGYPYIEFNTKNSNNSKVIDAFHRHFLPNQLGKKPTITSLKISINLLKLKIT